MRRGSARLEMEFRVTNETRSPLHCLAIRTTPSQAALLGELASALGYQQYSIYRNVEREGARFRVFADGLAEARRIRDRFLEALPLWEGVLDIPPGSVELQSVEREDWAEVWKEHFHTFRASRRIVVKPTWEAFHPAPDDVVLEFDPGMCFGTGYHGTTRACLEFMDDLADELGPVPFLDAGCGSGILSLAAVKLGYWPVSAFDCDIAAVRTTGANLARAGVTGVACSCADMGRYVPAVRPRVVAVNILSGVLHRHASAVASWLSGSVSRGHLLLAGMLTEQYAAVRDVYLGLGFQEIRRRTIDEWTSGCYSLPACGAPESCASAPACCSP